MAQILMDIVIRELFELKIYPISKYTHNIIQFKLVEIQVFMLVRMELIVRYLGLVNVLDCFNLA